MKNEHAVLEADSGEAPVLKSVHASGRLEGLLLSMTLAQCFKNESSENVEVVYSFPLPWQAVITGMAVTVGGKKLISQVLPRADAVQDYENAVEAGDAPVMLRVVKGTTYSLSIGSVAAGEAITIELSYAQLLRYEADMVRLVVPTTLAPRYGDPITQGGFELHEKSTHTLLDSYEFKLRLEISGALAASRLSSPSHRISVDSHDQGTIVQLQRHAWLDRDFVLLAGGMAGQSFAIAGPDPAAGEGCYALLASFRPEVRRSSEFSPLAVKILVDCSGSMNGERLVQARGAIESLRGLLQKEDFFSLSTFGTSCHRLMEGRRANEEGLAALTREVAGLNADLGGTELGDALLDTFGLTFPRSSEAAESDVLLITDGDVWDAQALVDAARRSGHRVYALGVGSAPQESLLRELAEATGGSCELMDDDESMVGRIARMIQKMRFARKVEANLRVSPQPTWVQPLPRRIIDGETVHVFCQLTTAPEAPALQIDGKSFDTGVVQMRSDDLIARLAAACRLSLATSAPETRDTAIKYQLVTEQTNLLLVVEREPNAKTTGMPALRRVPSMLPAGWGGTGAVVGAVAARSLAVGAVASLDFLAREGLPGSLSTPSWSTIGATRKHLQALKARFLRQIVPGTRAAALTPDIMVAFNAEASRHQNFRRAVQALSARTGSGALADLIDQLSALLGSPLKAWACALRWLHDSSVPGFCLEPGALALVNEQMQAVDAAQWTSAKNLLETAAEHP